MHQKKALLAVDVACHRISDEHRYGHKKDGSPYNLLQPCQTNKYLCMGMVIDGLPITAEEGRYPVQPPAALANAWPRDLRTPGAFDLHPTHRP